MPNNSTITIACALCVGAAREPYLAAALAGIVHAVDSLVVNDNSGLARSDARATLDASAFAARGDLRIERHPFVDFADMRNRAFAQLAALPRPPDWVVFLDADEVHGEQIRYLAREVLPQVSTEVANVDAYTYHFFGTYRWISDIARRFVFYRYRPELHWINRVHETVVGLAGKSLVLPYIYHHYGNVLPPALLARKHARYFELGNPVARPPDERTATHEIYLARAPAVRPFCSTHPRVVHGTLAAMEAEFAADFAAIDSEFVRRRTPRMRAASQVRRLNESLRVQLRRLEHPGFYRERSVAR